MGLLGQGVCDWHCVRYLITFRLYDFRDTPSSSLTINQFMEVDLEQEHDPPSFRTAKKRAKGHTADKVHAQEGQGTHTYTCVCAHKHTTHHTHTHTHTHTHLSCPVLSCCLAA